LNIQIVPFDCILMSFKISRTTRFYIWENIFSSCNSHQNPLKQSVKKFI